HLRDLADRYERGELAPRDLEQQVRDVIAQADSRPGSKDVVTYNGNTPPAPLGSQPLTMLPRQPDRPIEFQTPNGDRVLVPTNPDQVTNRLRDGTGEPTDGQHGQGQIRVTMTAWFAEYEGHNGGPMQLTNSGSRSGQREYNFDSDAGTDFSALQDTAMRQAAVDSQNMLDSFGLPRQR
ncbi:MAG: hypothetical protein HY814_12620, partial [Candidatus Riflebacteria bacterium]|nr:hypothetical protein [Candidatus Riflebacteria bacterium]